MNKISAGFLRITFAISDLFILNFCLLLCYKMANKDEQFSLSSNYIFLKDCLTVTIVWLLVTRLFSLYNEYTLINQKCVFRATKRSLAIYMILFGVHCLFTNSSIHTKLFVVSLFLLTITCFLLSRTFYRLFKSILIHYTDKEKAVSVLAIASLGGHWIQLLRLMPLFKFNNVTFISTKDSLKNTVGGNKYYSVPDANRNNKFDLVKCCLSIFWVVITMKPEIIITTGAAPGLFAVLIGRLLGIKTVWLDSIANVEELSLSGNIATKIADRVYTQWEHLASPKIIFAGNILEG